MCSSADGHLTKKSTAFATVSAKYGTQSLLHDHMMSHYRRINNAKATIDNRAPKSASKSIKVRDRRRQHHKDAILEQKLSRPSTARSRPSTARVERPDSQNSVHFERPMTANGRLDDHYTETYNFSETDRFNGLDRMTMNHPAFRRENSDMNNPDFRRETNDLQGTMGEDEYRSRMQIRDNVKNNLNLSYKESKLNEKTLSSTPRYKIEMYGTDPDINPVKIKGSVFNTARTLTHWRNNTRGNSTLDTGRHSARSRNASAVPNLDLSSVVPDDLASRNSFSSRMSPRRKLRPGSSLDFDDPVAMKIQEQEYMIEEEQKYLRFIEDVTNDVLTRGIFSDRVLNQVFETHIEKKKNDLDETRMWSLINELREDLNIKDAPEGETEIS